MSSQDFLIILLGLPVLFLQVLFPSGIAPLALLVEPLLGGRRLWLKV